MNTYNSSSDETYLEAFIDQLTTSQWTYQVRRTMDLIRDLDTSCSRDLQSLQRLTEQFHTQIENTIIQHFDVVEMNNDENDESIDDVSDEIDEILGLHHTNKSPKDLTKNKKRKRSQYGMRLIVHDENNPGKDEEPVIIPTTEELLGYVLRQPLTPFLRDTITTTTKTSSVSSKSGKTTATLRDVYHQIQHLQRNCVQKTHEKVNVAQQAYELIDAQVQRLDHDIHNMELLLQVRSNTLMLDNKQSCVSINMCIHIFL
jgi:tRNA U34 5-carboxymethylaminomethyl modifying GTPase MnmE/TrmE